MTFIKDKTIGDEIILKKSLGNCCETFKKGTRVKITGKSNKGYDIEDDQGNRIIECGFDIGELVNHPDNFCHPSNCKDCDGCADDFDDISEKLEDII
jgi:hypothetical protein